MNSLHDFLKNELLVTDGAAGTYISSLTGRMTAPCELLNLKNPDIVLQMHRQYIQSGAKLIFSNTFGASVAGGSPAGPFEPTRRIIEAGMSLALAAAGDTAFAAADIGPLPEAGLDEDEMLAEYRRVADAFIAAGAKNFVLETFARAQFPILIASYIRERVPDAFVLISFAVLPDGFSRASIAGQRLIDDVIKAGCADAAGFNCCSGPAHLLSYAKTVDFGGLYPVIMPNAGYPQRESDDAPPQEADVTYSGSPEYFAKRLGTAPADGFRIIGGCCGTTPRHIELLAAAVSHAGVTEKTVRAGHLPAHTATKRENRFKAALSREGGKAVIVELEPPFDTDIAKLVQSASSLKDAGIDAITVADSPMARARADSFVTAAHLKRVTGIEVIPHLCCRDKNLNAIKSTLIAAHIEGIRNILAVTGDPVPDTDRGSVKSVFNLNSEGLCRFVESLNADIFSGDELSCGCAFNVNARNIAAELARLSKKRAAGACFVLTQPVFTDEAVEALSLAHETGAKMIVGLMTPVTYRNAVFLANEMPGFKIPEKYLRRFSPDMTREQGEEAGIAISVEIAEKVAPYADGFYFIVPFNRVQVTKTVIERLRVKNLL